MQEEFSALVVGAGPAGLMAASMLAGRHRNVLVTEAKPSLGRKLLMAGKSGLNLTMDKALSDFLSAYGDRSQWLAPMLRDFGPPQVRQWALSHGQETFAGSTGRVFPKAMKASPLLRAWARKLSDDGVQFRTRWRWTGWDGEDTTFSTPDGNRAVRAGVTVLALGGGSWARLGSDGAWQRIFARHGIDPVPFAPSNFGLDVSWSDHMARHFGTPVKGTALHCGGKNTRGEFVISRKGLEGGGIYALGPELRSGAPLFVDLFPDLSPDTAAERAARSRPKDSFSTRMRRTLRLSGARLALLQEFGRPIPADPRELAALAKAIPLRHSGPRPIDEAISTAGGVPETALDAQLMLTSRPGVYCAGEMLDWEAPTGGYLLTACFATGRWAGRAASDRLRAMEAETGYDHTASEARL